MLSAAAAVAVSRDFSIGHRLRAFPERICAFAFVFAWGGGVVGLHTRRDVTKEILKCFSRCFVTELGWFVVCRR